MVSHFFETARRGWRTEALLNPSRQRAARSYLSAGTVGCNLVRGLRCWTTATEPRTAGYMRPSCWLSRLPCGGASWRLCGTITSGLPLAVPLGGDITRSSGQRNPAVKVLLLLSLSTLEARRILVHLH